MVWSPVTGLPIQYSEDASGTAASGNYLKFYASGTTTPISMATDSTGDTTLAKCQLNSLGQAINGSSAVFIPHVDQKFKAVLYPDDTTADANTFASAIWVVDGITPSGVDALVSVRASGEFVKEFDTLAAAIASTTLVVGDVMLIKDRANSHWDVVLSSGVTENTYNIVQCTGVGTLSFVLRESFQSNPLCWGVRNDGTLSQTAMQYMITARASKSIVMPDGEFNFNAAFTGLDDVHIISSPRTTYTDVRLPTFNGIFTGNQEVALFAGVIRYYDATVTNLGHDYVNGETCDIVESYGGAGTGGTATVTVSGGKVVSVTLVNAGSGYTAGNAELISQTGNGRGCLVTTTVSTGAITAIAKRSGWYLIREQAGDHDPVLINNVVATGTASVIVELSLADFGLDSTLWTPSGFVCGPDETLAAEGVVFGASVGYDTITIQGGYPTTKICRNAYVYYDGANWVGTNASAYSYSWTGGANAYLTVTREPAYEQDDTSYMFAIPRINSGVTPFTIANVAAGAQSMQLKFIDYAGAVITSPTTDMRFYLYDPQFAQASTFSFSTAPTAGSNIWFIGAFTRKPGSY